MNMKLVLAALAALVLVGCNVETKEEWKGAKPGDDCKELYKEHVNQNRCNLLLQEG